MTSYSNIFRCRFREISYSSKSMTKRPWLLLAAGRMMVISN